MSGTYFNPIKRILLNLSGGTVTGTTQELIYVNPTDIDSSGGNRIWSLGGVISNSDNWGVSNSSIVPVTISSIN